MKQYWLFLIMMMSVVFSFSQEVKRIQISGKIVVKSNDIQGVTIYNSSSNKGTITDEKGNFTINVAINDVIEFDALQFKEFKVTIDEQVIESKQITVFLFEEVNKLDEVVILPYDLTGNLVVDAKNVKTYNVNMDAIYFGIGNMDDFDFQKDYKTKVENIAINKDGQNMIYGIDPIAVIAFLVKPLFKSTENKKSESKQKSVVNIPLSSLKKHYSVQFLEDNFQIPTHQVEDFIIFVEDDEFDYALFKKGNELELLEYINQKSLLFLASLDEKK